MVDVAPLLLAALRDATVRAELLALVHEATKGETAALALASPFATLDAYASRCDVSPRTVRTWIGRGLPHVRQGSVVRVRVPEADAWLVAGGSRRTAVAAAVRAAKAARICRPLARVGVY